MKNCSIVILFPAWDVIYGPNMVVMSGVFRLADYPGIIINEIRQISITKKEKAEKWLNKNGYILPS